MNNIFKLIMPFYFGVCFFVVIVHVIINCILSNDMSIYTICEILADDFKKCIYLSYLMGAICLIIILVGTFFPRIRKLGCSVLDFQQEKNKATRDLSVDILKGLLIIVMIIGHSTEIAPIKNIIYSVHMPAFVIMSGYFYKKRETKIAIVHLIQTFLIPYAIFACFDLGLKIFTGKIGSISQTLSKYFFGVSFSNKWFPNVESIGPIYFVLLLFLVRLIYIFIDACFKREIFKIFASVLVSLLGALIGYHGYWLPWSLDCAMYAVLFYLIGIYLKKYQVLHKISDRPYLFFIFMGIWVYMIYNSNFEIAFRFFYPYALVIIGATCGTIILYMLSNFLYKNMPDKVVDGLCKIGTSTIYILIVHTIYRDFFANYLERFLDSRYIYNLIVSIFLQVGIGILIGLLARRMNANNSNR